MWKKLTCNFLIFFYTFKFLTKALSFIFKQGFHEGCKEYFKTQNVVNFTTKIITCLLYTSCCSSRQDHTATFATVVTASSFSPVLTLHGVF